MPLDGIFLHFLKNELNETIIGSRVEKVHQPSKDELLLWLRSRNGASRLFISASANSPRVHLTENSPENPASPPMLCMLLRKYLCGSVITDVSQDGLDRTLKITFDGTNEIGDKIRLFMYVEIMAKHSNIILVNGSDGKIVDAVKRIDLTQSSYRQILPGFNYVSPPPQTKLSLLTVSVDSAVSAVLSARDKQLSSAVLATLEGTSPLISREIAELSGGDIRVADMTESQTERFKRTVATLSDKLLGSTGEPYLLLDKDGRPKDFSFTDITQYGFSWTGKKAESFSKLLDGFYCERDRLDRTHQRAADMFKILGNAVARISKKLTLQKGELSQCGERENLRIKAELINANLSLLSKGSLFYDLENYYDECKILRIPADPALTPAANAQKYYKEYRKAKTAELMLTQLIEQGEQELSYLETVSDSLSRASTHAELDAIRSELQQAGYVKKRGKDKQKAPKPLPPMEYVSKDGFRILVGRNNIQNEQLSLKTAKGGDLWLHTQKIPGSHVIVVADGKQIPDSTVEQAASIAAYHSKAREATLAEVDYTLAKNLKKPQGSRPGKVIYHVYNSISVKPELPE